MILVVPFRAVANARGGPCLALEDLGGFNPLNLIARRFPSLPRFIAASQFGLTDAQRAAFAAAGYRLVEGEDRDLLGRLLAVARIAGDDALLRIPLEAMWLDEAGVLPLCGSAVAAVGADFGLPGEYLPAGALRSLAGAAPGTVDRERPQRTFVPAPPARCDAGRIAVETPADIDDARFLLARGDLKPDSPVAAVRAAFAALDDARASAARRPVATPARQRLVSFVCGTSLYGGSEEVLRETLRWTRAAGAWIRVIVPGPGPLVERLREDGVTPEFMAVPRRQSSPPGRFQRDVCALADAVAGSALVVAENITAPEAAVPAARLAGSAAWVHLHAILDREAHDRMNVSDADLVIGDSRAIVAAVPAARRVVLPNGVDLAYWRPAPPRAARVPCLMLAARTEPHKGHGLLVEAAEILAGRGCSFSLAFVGAATDPRSASYGEALRRRLDAGPLRGRYSFAGWSFDLRASLARADILVAPTMPPGEPGGRVPLYAMAMGIPVVASALGGPLDYVRDNVTGRLFAAGDAHALAGALAPLLTDPALRRSMGAAARAAVAELAIDIIALRWKSMLEEVLGRG